MAVQTNGAEHLAAGGSIDNEAEARVVRGMVLELLEVLQPSQIGVIALYKAQAVLIRKLLVGATVQDCLCRCPHTRCWFRTSATPHEA